MKWQYASISLVVITLAVLTGAILFHIHPGEGRTIFPSGFSGNKIQFGYYDLLAKNREIYDPQFQVRDDTVFMTLTSPDDNRFISKIKMQRQENTLYGVLYSYQPLYLSMPQESRIIQNVLSFMSQNGITFNAFEYDGRRMIVSPSGLIMSDDEKQDTPTPHG